MRCRRGRTIVAEDGPPTTSLSSEHFFFCKRFRLQYCFASSVNLCTLTPISQSPAAEIIATVAHHSREKTINHLIICGQVLPPRQCYFVVVNGSLDSLAAWLVERLLGFLFCAEFRGVAAELLGLMPWTCEAYKLVSHCRALHTLVLAVPRFGLGHCVTYS